MISPINNNWVFPYTFNVCMHGYLDVMENFWFAQKAYYKYMPFPYYNTCNILGTYLELNKKESLFHIHREISIAQYYYSPFSLLFAVKIAEVRR